MRKRRYWKSVSDDKIIEAYNKNPSLLFILKYLNFALGGPNRSTLRQRLIALNLICKKNNLERCFWKNISNEKIIEAYYSNSSITSILKYLGFKGGSSSNKLQKKLIELGLSYDKKKNKRGAPRFNNDKYIESCKLKHGNRYNYSLVEYVGACKKIKIICYKHGEFLVRADAHKNRGDGCPHCRKIRNPKENRCINCYDVFYTKTCIKKLCNKCVRRINFKKNRLKKRTFQKDYYHTVLKLDPKFVIKDRLKARLRKALKQYKVDKVTNTLNLLGCDMSFFIKYLENKFKDGMTWENRHLWHIDHIRPCASFDLTNPKEQRQCFHYTNLQPLWAYDNLKKHDKILNF